MHCARKETKGLFMPIFRFPIIKEGAKKMDEKDTLDELNSPMQHPDYQAEIVALVRSGLSAKDLEEKLLDYHENDIAGAMEELTDQERETLYTILDTDTMADVLEYSENLSDYIEDLPVTQQADLLSHIEASDAAEYLREADDTTREAVMDLIDPEAREEINLLSSFDEDEIGSRMSTNFITVKAGSTVKTAMKGLVEQAAENDNITTLYVTDGEETFLGAIDLKDLITARASTDLDDITMTSYPYVYASEQIEDCIARLRDYSEDSIPVLDSENKLQGVLLSQDIGELIGDVMEEDYAMLAGLSEQEDLEEPVTRSVGKRLPWLIILLGLGLLVSSVVGMFEHVVAHLSLIVCFQSLILAMAGNVGTQSLAVTIRVLMDENIHTRDKLYLVGKELRVGLLNGLILGTLSVGIIGGYLVLLKDQPAGYAFSISACTGGAMLLSIVLSSITGTVIPLVFKKVGVDPAVASGPLITTINDLVAVVSYYGLAWLFLIQLLGL